MILTLLGVLAAVILVGGLLSVIRDKWFQYYLIAIAFVIAVPLVLSYKVIKWITALLFGLGDIILQSFTKGVIVGSYAVALFAAILPSVSAYFTGRLVTPLLERLKKLLSNPALSKELEDVREILVEIIVEYDDNELIHSDLEMYRNELEQAKKQGSDVLSVGESVLSISLGGLLVISQGLNLRLFEGELAGLGLALLVSLGLVAVSLSVAYRIWLLDFISFDASVKLDSLEEADVKLSYQKLMASASTMKHLMLILAVVMHLSDADRDLARELLELHYGEQLPFLEVMREGWKRIRK